MIVADTSELAAVVVGEPVAKKPKENLYIISAFFNTSLFPEVKKHQVYTMRISTSKKVKSA